MNLIDRTLAYFAPVTGLRRVQARQALAVTMNYDAASRRGRASMWKRSASDADAAGSQRASVSYATRDMIRNAPFAAKGVQVIQSNVVGDGIIPKITGTNARQLEKARADVKAHCDTVAIDAYGRNNLYGLQRLVMGAVAADGEVLVRIIARPETPLGFVLQVMEADHLDDTRDTLGGAATGNVIYQGIEYDRRGVVQAYWLYPQHPGNGRVMVAQNTSVRVPAREIVHVFRQDRPGQLRGVSWFAPVAVALRDWTEHQDAKLTQQKIAACFAVMRTGVQPDDNDAPLLGDRATTIQPGRIENLMPGEGIATVEPPTVQGYDEFSRVSLRAVAAGLGITYESLTGDLSGVNFSSGRMGRLEMDRNVSAWQWLMLIPQFCERIGAEIAGQLRMKYSAQFGVEWTPPQRFIVDPNREVQAMVASMEAGLSSRQGNIRALGYDPEDVRREQVEDKEADEAAGLVFKGAQSVDDSVTGIQRDAAA